MSNNLATTHPAEVLDISPEALEVANCYLILQDSVKVSDELNLPVELVSKILSRNEVKAYIDNIFYEIGFNNKFKMRKALDAILAKKFEEMDESDTGSTKDIADLLMISHKITMETMAKEIELAKVKQGNLKTQVNVQVNNTGGSNYGSLIDRIINNSKI